MPTTLTQDKIKEIIEDFFDNVEEVFEDDVALVVHIVIYLLLDKELVRAAMMMAEAAKAVDAMNNWVMDQKAQD